MLDNPIDSNVNHVNKVKHLICDSGPFICGTQIQDFGKNIYTLPEVVAEIKDENTRQRLQFITYDIKYREPSAEDIQFVVNFSKKTGDFCQLSATDIKVIALTLRLEKEINGQNNIKIEPQIAKVVNKTALSLDQLRAGFYGFDKKDKNKENHKTVTEINGSTDPQISDKQIELSVNETEVVLQENKTTDPKVEEEEVENNDQEEDDDQEDEDESDEGWITPHNVEEIRRQMMGIKVNDEVEEELTVGCMTGDYAMQNVLIQMGLKVISIRDGLRIRQTKQFVLRCFACFKINNKPSNDFCNFCGNYKTLKRVALTLKEDGTKEIFINFKKPINIRGTKYSLPMPKAGKHVSNPVLVADQPIPQQRKSRFSMEDKKSVNSDKILTDPDYVNRTNPFAIKDVYSRGSRLAVNVRRRVNPNETRKSTGNRKKKSGNH